MQKKYIATVLAVGLAFAGCGGDDEERGSSQKRADATEATTAARAPGNASNPGLASAQAAQDRRVARRYEDLGREAAGAERAAILHAVDLYATALTGEDWKGACAMVSQEFLRIYRQQRANCERLLAMGWPKLVKLRPGLSSRPTVTSVRVKAGKALVFLKLDRGGSLKWAFQSEGKTWKVGAQPFE